MRGGRGASYSIALRTGTLSHDAWAKPWLRTFLLVFFLGVFFGDDDDFGDFGNFGRGWKVVNDDGVV